MKKKLTFISILAIHIISLAVYSQCSIEAGLNSSIICGSSVQLDAQPMWISLNFGKTNDIKSLFFINADTGYASGFYGEIVKTTNGGGNWTSQVTGTKSALWSLYFVNANIGYAVGNYDSSINCAIILKTINGGSSWTKQVSGTSYNIYSVFFLNADTGYFAGDGGVIFKTINGGLNWTKQISGTIKTLRSVYFINADTGYVVGIEGTILKTTNGGTNWKSIKPIVNSNVLFSVFFVDSKHGYISGQESLTFYGIVLKTNDGGDTWTTTKLNGTSQITSLNFVDSLIGYACGSGYGTGKILMTTDGGNSWNSSYSVGVAPLTTIFFSDENIGYAAGWNNPILKLNNPISYEWSPAIGLSATNIKNPIANPIATTKYFVIATTLNGCISTDSLTVFIDPLLVNAGIDQNIICGAEVKLDSIASNYSGNGILSYNWVPSTGLNNNTIPNPTAIVIESSKYVVTLKTSNGCMALDSIKIEVTPLTVNKGLDKIIVCGAEVKLDSIISNYTGNKMLSYKWMPSTGLNFDTIPNPTTAITESTTYFITVETPNGCIALDSIKIEVSPLTISANDVNINCGDSAFLTTSTNYMGTGNLTYSWLPIVGLNNPDIANPISICDSNIIYTVSLYTVNGCVANDEVYVKIIPLTAPEICIVGVNSNNKNMIIWNKKHSTVIDSYFVYKETNITNVYQYIGAVNKDSLSVFEDTNSFPSVQSNKYKISIKDKCGLETMPSDAHKTMHLTINQGMGTSWNLIWDEYQGFQVSTYNIFRGTTSDSLFHIGTSSGSNTSYSDLSAPSGDIFYQVELISPNQCNPTRSYNSSLSNIASNNDIGTFECGNKTSLFSIYPNPGTNWVIIKTERTFASECILKIFNPQGKLIMETKLNDQNTLEIDVNNFSKGIYYFKLETEKGIDIQKFIKK